MAGYKHPNENKTPFKFGKGKGKSKPGKGGGNAGKRSAPKSEKTYGDAAKDWLLDKFK